MLGNLLHKRECPLQEMNANVKTKKKRIKRKKKNFSGEVLETTDQ